MKYLQGTALYVALVAALYFTADVYSDKEYQGYAQKFAASQKDRIRQREAATKSKSY
jgi:hypothetical protein